MKTSATFSGYENQNAGTCGRVSSPYLYGTDRAQQNSFREGLGAIFSLYDPEELY